MKRTWMRRLAGAVCVCAALFLIAGCGGEDDNEVDGSTLDEDAAKRAIDESEQIEKGLLDVQKKQEETAD